MEKSQRQELEAKEYLFTASSSIYSEKKGGDEMKRTTWLILLVLVVGLSIFYLRNWAPFMAIAGKSMEPTLSAGDLVVIKKVSPLEIKEGDVIIFEVPGPIRDYYNYPLVVAHRVIEIQQRNGEIVFRTKGDNTGEDPFIVRPIDLKGKVGETIPLLGLPLFFLQSKQGLISVAAILFLVGLGTYSREIGLMKRKVQKAVFAPILEEQREVKKALNDFASATQEYAQHLKSHTEAIQGLAKSAEKLAKITEKLDKQLSEREDKKGE